MKVAVALTVFVLGVSLSALSACKDENRACCAKIEPPHERAEESSSAAESSSSS